MKSKIVRIGNSQGIRIPKALLDSCHLDGPLEIDVQGNQLVVRSASRPRHGWDEAFRAMHQQADDRLVDPEASSLSVGIKTNGSGSPPVRSPSRSYRSHQRTRNQKKTRPFLIISADEMNRHIDTVIIAPMTTKSRPYPSRVPVRFRRKTGQIVLDELRTVDRSRLVKRLGAIDPANADHVLTLLAELFAPYSLLSHLIISLFDSRHFPPTAQTAPWGCTG
jgi:mRNA interferase MazF